MMGLQIAYVIQFLGLVATVAFVGALVAYTVKEIVQKQIGVGSAAMHETVTGGAL